MTQDQSIESTYKREFEALPESAINTAVLKTAPFSSANRIELSSVLVTEEYVSLCPWSGLPDHATLRVFYHPSDKLLEMKSYKYFITSFHNVGITMERACQRICQDLGVLLNPKSLFVEMSFNARGGFKNFVRAEWESSK